MRLFGIFILLVSGGSVTSTLKGGLITLDLPDNVVQYALARFGEVEGLHEEVCSQHSRYNVPKGIRVVSRIKSAYSVIFEN
jgi:hypothetical protein